MSGSTRDAYIRLKVERGPFKSGIKDAEGDVKESAGRMKEALSGAFREGIKGADAAVKGMVSGIKSTLTTLSGIGGVAGTTELIREALKTEGIFKNIAFRIKAGTGELANFRDIMGEASSASQKWGKDIDELGETMKGIWEETGNEDFMRDSIDTIATVSRASKEPVQLLGQLAGTLNEKFGVTQEQLGATLASVISLGNKGGVTVDELAGRIGFIGAVAKEAGFQGEDGFNKMIGLLNVADDGGKNLRKNLSAVSGILEDLGQKTSRTKTMAKLGIDPSSAKGDVTDMIGQILKKTGGNKDKLAVAFQGEQLAFMVDLGKKYAGAFEATSGDVKTKTAAALAAYETALRNASTSTLTYEDIQKDAAKAMEGGQAKIDAALQKMKAAFLRPEVGEAISKLADVLPILAEAAAKAISFLVEHPVLGAGMAVGGVALKGAIGSGLSSLLTAALSRGGVTAGASIASALTGAAPGAASALAGAGASFAGTFGLALAGAGIVAGLVYAIGSAIQDHMREAKQKEYEVADKGGVVGEEGTGGGSGASADGGDFVYQSTQRDEMGNFKVLHGDEARAEKERQDKVREEWKADLDAQAANAAKQSFMRMDNLLPSEAAAMYGGKGKAGAGGTSGMSAENARLLADMLRSSPLGVKITNPEAIRGAGGGGGADAPVPGYVDRG